MKKFWKIFGRVAGILTAVIGVLFVVYFWNLDQKLMGLGLYPGKQDL